MKIIFPYNPLKSINWKYFWNKPNELFSYLVKFDPFILSSDARQKIASYIAVVNTPFKDVPYIHEQDRRGQTPVFKLWSIYVAEREAHRDTLTKMEKYKSELISSRQEITRLKRLTKDSVGTSEGLQNL